MNRGVCTGPWGVWKQPQRARVRGQRAVTVKEKSDRTVIAPPRCSPEIRCRLPSPRPPASDPQTGKGPAAQPAAPGLLARLRLAAAELRLAAADLAGAWIFYSVLPAWPLLQPRFERIARFAPLIGLLLGGLQGLLWWSSAGWLPETARLALVLALGLALSGGLHSDGAMDTADGLAAGDRALEAMEDSRVGAAAVQVFAQLLLLRLAGLAALAVLPAAAVAMALVWTGGVARLAPLLAMEAYPYLRDQGTAGFHRRHWRGLGRELLPAALVAPAALAALLASWPGGSALAAAALALVPAVAVPHWLGRRLGGHSGDSYGACVEWSEALGLLLMGLVARAAA